MKFFRFEWKVRNHHESVEQELVERNSCMSEMTDVIDWLNAAHVKVRSAPGIDLKVGGRMVHRLITEHEVVLSFRLVYCIQILPNRVIFNSCLVQ